LAKYKEDYLYATEEAEEIAKRQPEDTYAKEMLEVLRAAKDKTRN
jgi:hypothetical protein